MREIKMHTTLYWQVPDDIEPAQFISVLESLAKSDVLKLAYDFGDSTFEVNEND